MGVGVVLGVVGVAFLFEAEAQLRLRLHDLGLGLLVWRLLEAHELVPVGLFSVKVV